MSAVRIVAAAMAVLAIAVAPGCGRRPTRVLDRPDLSRMRFADLPTDPIWEERVSPPADGHYFAAAAGDLDGDGVPDLVAGSFEPGGISVWMGREDGTWEFSFVSLPSSSVRDVALADLEGDGRDEIVAVSRGGTEGLLLMRAPEEGPWGRPESISNTPGFEAVSVGDIDGDGRPDLAAARGGDADEGGIQVWLGDGSGGLRAGFAPQTGGSFRDVLLADLDGDTRLDLIGAGWGLLEGVRLFWGDGRGGFRAGPVLGVPGRYRGLALGDVTGDGRADLVATTYRQGVRVIPGLDPAEMPCSPIDEGSFWSPLVVDADTDGRMEIYAPSTNGVGVLAWTHEEGCRFRAVPSGLPDRDVWYGLSLGMVRTGGGDELLVAGFTGGLKIYAPKGAPAAAAHDAPLLAGAPEPPEEAWARGNDTFTVAPGYPEYRLGVNDLVQVRVFNGEEIQESESMVQSDGEIFVPVQGIGSVEAAGLSPSQLKRTILEKASNVWRNPDVEVVVLKYRAHKVSVLGEVRTTARVNSGPGQYPLEGKTRVVDFLSRHGGPTERADLNRVQLIRPSGRSSYLNLYKAIFVSDQRENPILNDGDTVFVPSVSLSNRKVFVLGEVNQPGLLELRENITLLEAIARSEGLTDEAVLKQVLVIRGGLESPELISVNLRQIFEMGDLASDVVLRNGDVVYVPRRVLADVKDAFMAIQPALNLIEDIFIINELVEDD